MHTFGVKMPLFQKKPEKITFVIDFLPLRRYHLDNKVVGEGAPT